MITLSTTHIVLIPSYNTGEAVLSVVREALLCWQPVWVVLDGSDDCSGPALIKLAETEPHLRIFQHTHNQGKGSAIYTGIVAASQAGFTHVLTMDADGQHPASSINTFMQLSMDTPETLIIGEPVFADNAPALRVQGRKISNFWCNFETLWAGIHDSLFGFRLYPIHELKKVMEETIYARHFDFDPEVAVRLAWQGLSITNVAVPVRYFSAAEGGVSQFRYFRDNSLLTWMHLRLLFAFILRLPKLIRQRLSAQP